MQDFYILQRKKFAITQLFFYMNVVIYYDDYMFKHFGPNYIYLGYIQVENWTSEPFVLTLSNPECR